MHKRVSLGALVIIVALVFGALTPVTYQVSMVDCYDCSHIHNANLQEADVIQPAAYAWMTSRYGHQPRDTCNDAQCAAAFAKQYGPSAPRYVVHYDAVFYTRPLLVALSSGFICYALVKMRWTARNRIALTETRAE